jgi:hypothetical protein
MATLMPWTTVEVGDLEIFAPAVPCLVVNTWYMDGEPDSTVTYFWQDEATGLINHELVYAGPVSFETALAWAQEHAPTRGVERIHVKHGPAERKRGRSAAKTKRGKKVATPVKRRVAAKAEKAKKRGRKSSAR